MSSEMTSLFPIFANLKDCNCLIIGGGNAAAKKILGLIKTGANIRVVSKHICQQLEEQTLEHSNIVWIKRDYKQEDINAAMLIIAATDDPEKNRSIFKKCKEKNKFVNSPDQIDSCNFYTGATIDKGPMQISISSSGKSPSLARYLKYQIEKQLPANLALLAQSFSVYRKKLKQSVPSLQKRVQIWNMIFHSDPLNFIKSMSQQLSNPNVSNEMIKDLELYVRKVFFVGSGPGNPELLSLKAHKLLQIADVIIYDRLVGQQITTLFRKDACHINVGKKKGMHTMSQDKICETIVSYAKSGNIVVRLKGGDPGIFGRLGEEINCLKRNQIPYSIVPSISAANAGAADLGIPLTCRDEH